MLLALPTFNLSTTALAASTPVTNAFSARGGRKWKGCKRVAHGTIGSWSIKRGLGARAQVSRVPGIVAETHVQAVAVHATAVTLRASLTYLG